MFLEEFGDVDDFDFGTVVLEGVDEFLEGEGVPVVFIGGFFGVVGLVVDVEEV